MKKKNGFTLIELVIVATIISILVAIAIPNFVNAGVRAKVSSAYADLSMLAVAMESYYSDFHQYPLTEYAETSGVCSLTSPVAYFRSLPNDPFGDKNKHKAQRFFYNYRNLTEIDADGVRVSDDGKIRRADYLLWSRGPDFDDDYSQQSSPDVILRYDPTNGTTSDGDITVLGPR